MSLYKSYGIYGIRNNVNGNVYVGKTLMNFGDRRDCHMSCLRKGHGVNRIIQFDWDKYGEENFEFFVIYDCTGNIDKEDVNELEKKFIKKYKDSGISYNIGSGGDESWLKGSHLSDESKRKIGEKNKINMTGRKASHETKLKMSESQKMRYQRMTEEQKESIREKSSKANKGRKWSEDRIDKFIEEQKTKPRGAKYTKDVVIEMRKLHEENGFTSKEISDRFNIPKGTVDGILKYKRWKYI